MNCRTFARKLYDYQDGTLAAADKAEFELHRSGCPHCAARMESESRNAQMIRAAVDDACEGLDPGVSLRARFVESTRDDHPRSSPLAGWRIPAAIAALLIMVLLLPPIARKLVPHTARSPLEQSMTGDADRWAEEIQVTYETGFQAETTLISHDSGITTIIAIQVSYEQ